jgi:hypothetical protein
LNSEVAGCDRIARELAVLASGYVRWEHTPEAAVFGGYGKEIESLSGFFLLSFHVFIKILLNNFFLVYNFLFGFDCFLSFNFLLFLISFYFYLLFWNF